MVSRHKCGWKYRCWSQPTGGVPVTGQYLQESHVPSAEFMIERPTQSKAFGRMLQGIEGREIEKTERRRNCLTVDQRLFRTRGVPVESSGFKQENAGR